MKKSYERGLWRTTEKNEPCTGEGVGVMKYVCVEVLYHGHRRAPYDKGKTG